MSLVMKIKDMKQLLKRSLTDLKAAREELAAVKARNVSLTAALADKCKGCEYLETDKRYMNEFLDKLNASKKELAELKTFNRMLQAQLADVNDKGGCELCTETELMHNEYLTKELDALKEKYRWRVQGKENAPDWECILYITKNKEVRIDVGRGLEDGERWMPLPDIPKEPKP